MDTAVADAATWLDVVVHESVMAPPLSAAANTLHEDRLGANNGPVMDPPVPPVPPVPPERDTAADAIVATPWMAVAEAATWLEVVVVESVMQPPESEVALTPPDSCATEPEPWT